MKITTETKGVKGLAKRLARMHLSGEALGWEIQRYLNDAREFIAANSETLFFHKGGAKQGGNRLGSPDTLFVSDPLVSGTSASCTAGWAGTAAAYGRVLERGPRKKNWIIEPRGLLVRGHGPSPIRGKMRALGDAVKALRFYSVKLGMIAYARRMEFHWNSGMLRPHWHPALKAARKAWVERLKKRLEKGRP